jgi:hypothetical protein
VEFYGDRSTRIVVGGLLSRISIAVFVVAASGLRRVLIELPSKIGFSPTSHMAGSSSDSRPGWIGAESVTWRLR